LVFWADDLSARDQLRDASAVARDRPGKVAGAALPGLGRLAAHPKGDLPMNDPRHLAPVRDGDQAERMIERAAYEIRRVIAGQDVLLERTFVALLARGHLLIEGVPGLAKTLTIRTVAAVLGGTFQRVQFTPDLVPSDLVGTRIYRARSSTFDVELGPVFCNFLLADEINRAPAKVQSALLEVMQEGQVTIGKQTHAVPSPFLVMATQNPIESEGTYALPEAQLDRFMLKVLVDYPDAEDELVVIDRALAGAVELEQALSLDELVALQASVRRVYVDPALVRYAQRLAGATRNLGEAGLAELAPYVDYGVSPRGPINLALAARALALLRGRRYVVADDMRQLAKDVFRHRIVLSYEALADDVSPDHVLDRVLAAVALPDQDFARQEAAS
jgi:MoxR-like ATPase